MGLVGSFAALIAAACGLLWCGLASASRMSSWGKNRKTGAMKRTLFFFIVVLAAAGCQRSTDSDSRPSSRDTTSSTSATNPANPSTTTLSNRPADNAARPDLPAAARAEPSGNSANSDKSADNTGKNERDRSGSAQTSGDQGGSEADRRVTQQIRKTIVDDPKLSTTAKNVKIITQDGAVTLRGPVKSTQEKTEIAAIAQKADGVKRVDNQLEIANK
jgi:hyperosmotically inducible protein